MSRLVLAAAACAALLATHQPAVAGRQAPGPDMVGCRLVAVNDPGTDGGGVKTGTVSGGPAVGDGTLTCTVQVGASSHNGPDAASALASGTGVVVLPDTLLSFVSPAAVPVYVCMQWSDANGTVYWHPTQQGAISVGTTGHWTANASKPCGLTYTFNGGVYYDPPVTAQATVF